MTLYGRAACHLCDEMRAVIVAERERTPLDLDEVDIDTDDALVAEYGLRIPVVLVDGEELAEVALDPDEFAAAVRSGRPEPQAGS